MTWQEVRGTRSRQEQLAAPRREILYADEARTPSPTATPSAAPGALADWQVTPASVLKFILGDDDLQIRPEFVGKRQPARTLHRLPGTNRGLMLIGEPGTAKSYLSELLAAGISGDSTFTIQGSAGTTEDNIKYS